MKIELSGSSKYYENHHILPKSLGGVNNSYNMVLLTPREHFICHWLLVKIYPEGTKERKKMLYAFWSMKLKPTQNCKRYINARAYELLRKEFVNVHQENMKVKQGGVNNSHFGKHWYTNRNTGECKHFITAPDETWIEGRNLFQGESEKIKFVTKQREFYRKLWNKYHSENWECVSKFGEENNIVECRRKFRKWIPYFRNLSNKTKHNRFNFPSNKELIGVYE